MLMNRIFIPPPPWRPTTQAADGLPRRRWLVAEIEKMAEDGYFRDDERFELVGGEIVPMSPKGIRHEAIRGTLALHMARRTRDDIFVISEPQFNLDDDLYLNPDILVHPAAIPSAKVRGGDALLVVEVADSSLRYDLNTKAPMYAAYGVREYFGSSTPLRSPRWCTRSRQAKPTGPWKRLRPAARWSPCWCRHSQCHSAHSRSSSTELRRVASTALQVRRPD
jgi:Uma2 family endonuclease